MTGKPSRFIGPPKSTVKSSALGRHGLGATLALLTVGPAFCGALTSAGCASSPSLTVEFDVPTDTKVQVEVVGPSGFKETIRATTTFDNVQPGTYQVRLKENRKRVVASDIDTIVAGSVEGSPADVDAGAPATIKVRYAREPASGRVWIPIAAGDKVVSFTGEELHAGGPPSYTLAMPAGAGPDAVAFRRGDMWVALAHAGDVVGFAAMTLDPTAPSPPPMTVVRGLSEPAGLAFDSSGDLFIAEAGARAVSRYERLDDRPSRRYRLATEGRPRNLAFSKPGTLYVTTVDPPAVVVYSAPSLGGAAPTPQGAIRGARTGLVAPSGIAFDADGFLWVSNGDAAPAVRFAADVVANVEGDVDALPVAVLAPPSRTSLSGFAFCDHGVAWFRGAHPESDTLEQGTGMSTPAPALEAPFVLGAERPRWTGVGAPAMNPPPLALPIRR